MLLLGLIILVTCTRFRLVFGLLFLLLFLIEFQGVEGELEDSPVAKSVPIMKKSHTENRNSESSSGASDSESSEDCSPVEGYKCTPSSKHIRSYTSCTIRVLHVQKQG